MQRTICQQCAVAHIAPSAHRFCQRQKHHITAFSRCPSGRLPRCARNDIKYFVRNKIHSLKSQNFDAIKPHKYKSILWGPRDVSFGVLKILVYRRTTSLLKSHYRSDNAHSFACVRLFPRVVCFSFDQPIVASDSRLSYACILLFPPGTQYPAGTPYFRSQ